MFYKGKTNQETSREIGLNESFGCFQDPIVERISYLCRKEREELEGLPDSFLVDNSQDLCGTTP